MNGKDYAAAYGPTAGDRIMLGDTGLVIEVEHDAQRRGDEFVTGFGKTARDGIHLRATSVRETCDVVISNAIVLDPDLGVRKTSIGIRAGRIAAIGRAGNPDNLDGVDVVVGTGTTIISAEGLIATAGAVDTHVHLMSPRVMEASLASGVTTILGQEFGPVWGVGVNSPWALRTALAAFDAWPVNIGFLARGSSSHPAPLVEALVEGGACGFKVHEDMGAHARALDTALRVAQEHDVQVAVHTDGLNESLSVEDTLAVLDGRTIHAFHIEGCGGGHVPDVAPRTSCTTLASSRSPPRTRSAQPTVLGPQFGGYGAAPAELSVVFVSGSARDCGEDRLPTRRRRVAVRGTRTIGLADMILNTRQGSLEVDPGTGAVHFDGQRLHSEPAQVVSLSRLYFL